MRNTKRAFSLVELSIVLVVIGILVAGLSVAGKMYINQAMLSKGRSITSASPVANMDGLLLWLETTSEGSFDANINDGDTVSNWNDINPQSSTTYDAILGGGDPTYVKNAINNMPAINFDGNDYMTNSLVPPLLNSQRSIIVVVGNFVDNGGTSHVLHYGAVSSSQAYGIVNLGATNVIGGHYWDTTFQSSQTFTSEPFIIVSQYDGSTDEMFVNGVSKGTNIVNLTTVSGVFRIGARISAATEYFRGNIGEVIIFNRALKYFEREKIEEYLSNKWNIELD